MPWQESSRDQAQLSRIITKALVRCLYQRAFKLTHVESDAWDLVQDTLERGLRRWPQTISVEEARRWSTVVLRNLFLDRCRSSDWRTAVRSDPDAVAAVPAPDPADLPRWRVVDAAVVWRALEQLNAGQSMALLMQCRDELSLREIARAQRVELSTVGVRLHRARSKLRALLSDPPIVAGAGDE
jgi:RNA polymerase sigma-70 factor, ECF subfamily